MSDNRKFAAALFAGASLLAVSVPAMAQDKSSADSGADTGRAADGSEIIVTGSRTIKNGDSSPTPVTVVTTESLVNVRPTSLTESLTIMPVFAGSRGQLSNPSATGGVGGGNGNAAQLNLRNIGGQRNLVLMDGRRVPPTSFTNIVDADVIPQLLIKRVDVVTGGVSAVYGSDAITGVVNFITDTAFKGLKVQASGGISQYGDGQQLEAGIAYGTALDDRGHFEVSYQYRDDAGVLRRSDRPWFTRPIVIGAGTTANPYVLIESGALVAQPFGGKIIGCGTGCGLAGQYFASNGVLSPFANGTTYVGNAGQQSGGAGGYLDNSLKAAQRSHQVYARLDYDLSDNVSAYLVGSGNFKRNVFYADDISLSNIVLSKANAFLPTAYQSQLVNSTFTFSQINNQAERFMGVPESRQLMFEGGLKGKLGGFDWDIAYTHGDSRLKTTLKNNVNNQKLSAALDTVTNSSGQVVCYAATQAATAGAYSDCLPLNLFGPTAASAAALDYVLDNSTYIARTKQDDVVASVSGTVADGWAGPITAALSGEWRQQTFTSSSTATPAMFADCTNLRFNCNATGSRTFLFRQTFAASPVIKQQVWEGAAEINLPLLKDLPLIQSFDLNGAARYTSYDTVGKYWTWKLGADWHMTDDLRFRGTVSRDIRAPTLNDLYAPTSVVIVQNQDLKYPATAASQLPSVNVSNPTLTAEIGNTWTVGAVYKPHFLPRFSLAIDYYNMKISNAIVTVQGFQPAIQQGCLNDKVALYCGLITRDTATDQVTQWLVKPINLAKITTYGLDIEANYQSSLGRRPFNLRFLAAWQPHIRYVQPSVTTIDQGGVAFGSTGITSSPSWRLTAMAGVGLTENVKLDLLYRWRNRIKISGDPNAIFTAGQGTIQPYGQLSANLAWTIKDAKFGKAEFFVNAQNIFNTAPPVANATGTANAPGGFGGWVMGDDPIGRYYTAGFRVKY